MNDLLIRLYEYKDKCLKMCEYYRECKAYSTQHFWYGRLDMVNEIITIIENELINSEGC